MKSGIFTLIKLSVFVFIVGIFISIVFTSLLKSSTKIVSSSKSIVIQGVDFHTCDKDISRNSTSASRVKNIKNTNVGKSLFLPASIRTQLILSLRLLGQHDNFLVLEDDMINRYPISKTFFSFHGLEFIKSVKTYDRGFM